MIEFGEVCDASAQIAASNAIAWFLSITFSAYLAVSLYVAHRTIVRVSDPLHCR